jgi:hypothetical protein
MSGLSVVSVQEHGQHHSWRPLHLLGGRRLSRLRWNLHLEGLASGEARRYLHSHEPRRCLHLQRLRPPEKPTGTCTIMVWGPGALMVWGPGAT